MRPSPKATAPLSADAIGGAATDIGAMATTITAITLDLDDTLWPIAPVMERADQALYLAKNNGRDQMQLLWRNETQA